MGTRLARRIGRRSAGFTLLELLIAVAVFGVVSALAYGGLNSVIRAKTHLEVSNERLASLQLAFSLLARDMEQIAPRRIRDDFGDFQPAVRVEGDSRGSVVEFTRSGWRNPAGFRRSHLQRVAYGLEDGQLVRRTWPVLDRVQGVEPQDLVVLEDVASFSLRLLGTDNQWHQDWPPLMVQSPGQAQQPDPVPRAIEVTLDVEGWGNLVRLFPVANGVPAATPQPGTSPSPQGAP